MRRFPGWVKRADRNAAYISASVRLADGRKIAAVITDISSDGCKVSCRRMLPIGEVVELAIAGRASFNASVRWWVPGNAGLRFVGVADDPDIPLHCRAQRTHLRANRISAEHP